MYKQKPLIGVTTSTYKSNVMWWCIWLGIVLSGGKAIRITAVNGKEYQSCAGYIISGGVDIDPACYGQKNTASVGIEPGRDVLEKEIIGYALENAKPMMGICRGAQMINIVQGGTLHQNARDFYENFVPTDSLLGKIFSRRLIHVIKESTLFKLFNSRSTLMVNSLHHQAINKLGNDLKIVAKDESGIVQAIEGNNLDEIFILGVQWHPEFMLYSKSHREIFKALITAVR